MICGDMPPSQIKRIFMQCGGMRDLGLLFCACSVDNLVRGTGQKPAVVFRRGAFTDLLCTFVPRLVRDRPSYITPANPTQSVLDLGL